jgi:HEAT repeat protein
MGAAVVRATWVAGLIAAALGTSARPAAQDAKSDAQKLRQATEDYLERNRSAQEAWAWQGEKQDGPTLLKEIAAARVAMDVEGDLTKIGERLQQLSLRASEAQSFDGQAEALVQAAVARAELQVRLGDSPQALAELRLILPTRVTTSGSIAFTRPSPAMTLALEAARKDARIVRRISELEKKPQGSASGGNDGLNELVDQAFGVNNYSAILEIGAPAFERFAQLILQEPVSFPGSGEDLVSLIRLDERRAARFLVKSLDGSTYLWRKRVLRAMKTVDVLEDGGTWTSTRPFVCLEPEWITLVECLLADRDTAQEALPFFASLEHRDALTDELVAAFRKALTGFGPDFATAAMLVFDHWGVVASAQPALEAALDLPDARLRRFAAEKLVNFERSEALLARAKDSDVAVRRCVVQAMGTRTGYFFVRQGAQLEEHRFRTRIEARDAGVFRQLLADSDEGVRAAAVGLIAAMDPPLGEAACLELCKDSSTLVRMALVDLGDLPPATYGHILATLAHDSSPQVIGALDRRLLSDFNNDGVIFNTPAPFFAAFEVRWNDAKLPLEPGLRRNIFKRLEESAEGIRALVAWTLAEPTPEALKRLAVASTTYLFALPDEFLARLLASSEDLETWRNLWSTLDDEGGAFRRPAALRLLLADPNAARLVRLAAARNANDGSPAFREALLAVLRLPSWKERPPTAEERGLCEGSARAFEPEPRNALALAVMRDPAISSEVADAFVSACQVDAPGGRELAQAVLERWFRPGAPWSEAVNMVLCRIGAFPDLASPELLERALPQYSEAVVDAIGEMADPAYLPLLRRAMKAEWLTASERNRLQREVAGVLGSFDDDHAVELLLEGMRSNDNGVREASGNGLIRISNYRSQAKSWREQAGKAPPTKASALAELVTMLTDKDTLVRKEAARGLAALGAVEALPDLIRALKDADPSVRAAAQQAIDRLNTASAANPLSPAPAQAPAETPQK